MRLIRYIVLITSLSLQVLMPISHAARIKDITNLAGVRDNQLVGYGLVVGLDGTGDKVNQTPFTQQSFVNMLLQFGIRLPVGVNLQLKNIAAVAISMTLPPFANLGQKIDITVASLGNATSLRSGELLMTPMRGADGQVYAVAQGSVVVSGFGAQGSDGSKVIVNSTASGRIPNGATVEKTIEMPFVKDGTITFELAQPDFSTAVKIEQAINHEFGKKVARALDAGAVRIRIENLPVDLSEVQTYQGDVASYKNEESSSSGYSRFHQKRIMSQYVPIVARIENIYLDPADVKAKVIVNARTGTIVVDQNVTISPVAVSHGNLSVIITETPFVSQPNAFANTGKTVVGKSSNININQAPSRAFVFAPGASLNDLVNAINAVGAAPGDLISILEAIKSAGALHAELDVI
jgi:flagellar P-ring protein precursor FlgI